MARFAIITGASTGIGRELAQLAAADGYDLLLAADTPFTDVSGNAKTLEVDLSTFEGVDQLLDAVGGRQIDLLCANAGHGLGHAFLDQEVAEWRHVIDTNVTGTLYLLQEVLRQMAARNRGKVLVTGSIAGFMPGSFQAVYNGTKAFIDSFVDAVRNEMKEKDGITITTLMPGATETEFFHRARMDDTRVGQQEKDDPADVARTGWDAVMSGKADVVHGFRNKLQAAASHVLPEKVTAEMHRGMAEPGSGRQ
ncbi:MULTISPECIES: SDR family NAD(P)-dependent oxidoreductase [unclassified Sphingomonas]|uniref:SDR family NAD(P)-dependent oxidoreductase n=1 Tax=unclassified Sphingomonas TaxID=196159 RepID=UPI0009289910|nr:MULTISPECIES: SDR family NAD(P)-dependent oxidoreductase [unclassified Sphingomonas]MBN8849983.1 SDR family NAD(P)-dependent oxidoreductase [Sphingomonas sp.]OJV32258.1 MAG: oxidoreductase [Sphingomonas sp. 67-36]